MTNEETKIPVKKIDPYMLILYIIVILFAIISVVDLIFIHSMAWYYDIWLGGLALLFLLVILKMQAVPAEIKLKLVNIRKRQAKKIVINEIKEEYGGRIDEKFIKIHFIHLTTVPPFKRPVWWAFVSCHGKSYDILVDAYEGFVRRNARSYQYPRVTPEKPIMELEERPPAIVIEPTEET